MLLGFDFDAVIAQTALILCDILTEKVKRTIQPEHITMYGLQDNVPELSDADVDDVITSLVGIECTFRIPPYSGSMDFLRWYAKTNPIYVITNRPYIEPVWIYLEHNLDKATFNKVDIIYAQHKGAVAKSLGITYFVEDRIENIIDLANNGIVPIMFLQNWNRNIFTGRENITQLIRFIENWEEMYSIVHCEMENMI